MKGKKFKKLIATMACAGVLAAGAFSATKVVDFKSLNLFSNPPISVMAENDEPVDGNPFRIYDGDTLSASYDTLDEAISKAFSGNIIKIFKNFDATETCTITGKDLIIEGNGCVVNNKTWGKTIFNVSADSTLEIKNLIIDGGASTWEIDYEGSYIDGTYARIPTKNYESEVKATASAIKSSGNLIARNLTIQNIFTSKGGNETSGGVVGAGVFVSSGTLQLIDCNFKHIAGSRGAAVDCNGSLSTVAGKESTEYPITSVVVTGTTFDGNHACGRGGGINLRNVKETTIINSTFKNNASTRNNGGGIMFDADTMTKTISDNGTPEDTADDIKITVTKDEYLGLPLPRLNIQNSVFEGNYCGNDGFAIENEGAESIIKNCQFLRNVGVNDIQGSVGTVSYQVKHYGWVPQLLESCVFDGNKGATSGVGDHASNVEVVVKDTEFKNNQGVTSMLIYNAQIELDGVKFTNETVGNAVIDARSYVDADAYSSEIDANGPTLILKDTTIKDTQGSEIDINVRSQNSADNKAPFKVILEGTTQADIQVSNNGELEIKSSTHTGNVTVDPTGDKDNVVVDKKTNLVGKVEETNEYMVTLIYYTAEGEYAYKKAYLPAGKATLVDMQSLVTEEKSGYVLKWYTSNKYDVEWDYNVTNALSLYGQWEEHEHDLTACVVKGNVIYKGCDCGLIEDYAKELSIVAPTNLIADGTKKAVLVTNTLEIAETDYTIEYYKKTKSGYVQIEEIPSKVGTYKAVLKYATYEVETVYAIKAKNPFPAGVVIGCAAVGVGVIAAFVWYFVKKKKK